MKIYNNLKDIQDDLLSQKITCLSLVKDYIQRINSKKHLNIFIEVFEEEAISRAEEIDLKIKSNSFGKLAGMVVSIKDNICYKNHKVTASSKILSGFKSLYSSTAIKRLLDEDAIIIGRTNCDEFAMGSSNKTSFYGPTLNPINEEKVPGGSSGGAAASVAANLCLSALGSDTGGSVRQPASFCNIVGFKPSYGSISRWGLISYASSFDQIGPLAHTVEDIEVINNVISGYDKNDSTSLKNTGFDKNTHEEKRKKVAYFKNFLEIDQLDPEIKSHFNKTVSSLKSNGHTVKEINFPYLNYLLPVYYILTTAEASSNLARYDGVHFGYRSNCVDNLESTYVKSRTEGFGEEVKRRIMLGTFVLSSDYYDSYYTTAQKVRRLILDETFKIFKEFDFIISPTSIHTAFDLNKHNSYDPTKMYFEDIFTVQANITGCCAISLPSGIHSNGLPFGIQLLAQKNNDNKLLSFSREIMNI